MAGEATNPTQGVTQAAPVAQAPALTGVSAFRAYLESGNTPTNEPDANQAETPDVVEDENLSGAEDESDGYVPSDQPEIEGVDQPDPATTVLTSKVMALIDGQEHEITVDEAVKGYQRQADYQRKTQDVARVRTELVQTTEQYKQGLELISKYFLADLDAFKTLDWDNIKSTDPAKWTSLKIEQQEAQAKAQSLQAAFNEASQLQFKQQQEALQAALPAEFSKLVDKFPDYRDPVKQKEIAKSWSDYGLKQGFAAEELNQIIDHRMLVVLDKAMKYDTLVAKTSAVKDKKLSQNPVIIKKNSVTNQVDKTDRDYSTALGNLKAKGDKASAIEVFKQRLQRGL